MMRLAILMLVAVSLVVSFPFASTVHADEPMPYEEYRAFIARVHQEARDARSQSRAECATTLHRIAAELEAVTAVRMPDGTVLPMEHCCGLDEALRASSCDTARAEAYLAGICPGCVSQVDEQSFGGPGQMPGGGGDQPGSPGAGDGDRGMPSGGNSGGLPGGQDTGQGTGSSGQSGGQGGGQGGQPQPASDGEGLPNPMGLDILRNILEELGVFPDSGNDTATDQSGGQGPGGGEPGSGGDDQGQPGGQGPGGDDQDQSGGQGSGRDEQGQPSDDGTGVGPFTWGSEDYERLVEKLKTIPVIVWLVAAFGLLLMVVGLAVLWMRRAPKPEPETTPKTDNDEEDDVTSSVEAVDRAQKLVAAGDYRAAVRYLFLAALLALDERGLLRFDQALTNRELLRSTQANPILSEALAPVTVAFDRVWYGFEPLTQSDYETLVEQITTLNQL